VKYVALLRGINVGGSSLIRMADLRACVGDLGFEDVGTYIASGNLLFRSSERKAARLESQLETAIKATFGFPVRTVVRSRDEVSRIVGRLPAHWHGNDDLRVNVAFALREADTRAIARGLRPKEGIDELVVTPAALLMATRRDSLGRTGFRLIGTTAYPMLTFRNFNTTLKIAALLDA